MAVRQPTRKPVKAVKAPKSVPKGRRPRKTIQKAGKPQAYGTSKLETRFARNFLDRLGLKYIYEYEARDIGRFFDFAVTSYPEVEYLTEEKNGITGIVQNGQNVPISVVIEVDGSYVHGDPRVVKGGKLNRMQRRSKFVDAIKDAWCQRHGYRLLRIWEYDIDHDPSGVMTRLEKVMEECAMKRKASEWRKKPH